MAKKDDHYQMGNIRARVFILLLGIVAAVAILVVVLKWDHKGATASSEATLYSVPDIQSVPGEGNPTDRYVKAVQVSNTQQADAAAKNTKLSGVPTITRAGYVEGQVNDSTSPPAPVQGACDTDTLQKAKLAGVTASELRCKGCTLAQLKAAGYTAADLRAAGFSAKDLKAAGFSAADLRAAGFSADELMAAGFTQDELTAAGYPSPETATAQPGCGIADLQKARAAGETASDLKATCSLAALKAAGFTAAELKAAGFSAADLRAAGFTAKELKDAGFSAQELAAAGFSAGELAAAGFSAQDLKDAGFSIPDMKAAGVGVAALAAANVPAEELRAAGYSDGALIRAGVINPSDLRRACNITELQKAKSAGVQADDLKTQGCDATSLAVAGYSVDQLQSAGFSFEEVAAAKATTQGTPAATTSSNPQESNLDRLKRLQSQQLAVQQDQQRREAIEALMMAQSSQLFAQWNTHSTQQFVKASASTAQGTSSVSSSNTATVASVSSRGPAVKLKAGDVLFAVLDTGINSDEQSPVLATIVGGRLKGARIIGSFKLANDQLILSFNTISVPQRSQSTSIQAVAIDENTARTSMEGDVDYHYAMRYGSLFLSAFVSGYAKALENQQGTQTTSAAGTTTVFNPLNTKDNIMVGLGQVGTQYSTVMGQNFTIPPTVTIKSGTGFGLLLTADTSIPLTDKEDSQSAAAEGMTKEGR